MDADIARTANSPALERRPGCNRRSDDDWRSFYGELAAMMPKAGASMSTCAESLGPLWASFIDTFPRDQTGTMPCVAFGKFLGVSFPRSRPRMAGIAHVRNPLRPVVLGNMEIGVNTANLTGIVIVFLLAFVNMFGVKLGSMIQNVFTSAMALWQH